MPKTFDRGISNNWDDTQDNLLSKIQGVSLKILGFQMAVAQKRNIFDPMLVKPKLVWEAVVLKIKFLKKSKKI